MTPAHRWLGEGWLAFVACAVLSGVLLSLVPPDAVLAQRPAATLGDASGVRVSAGAEES